MSMYNIIKKDNKYSVEMGWRIAEKFTSFLVQHNMNYNLKCAGDILYIREVEFWGTEFSIKEAFDYIEMIERGITPCPFCGGVAKLKRYKEADANVLYEVACVICDDCGARTRSVIVDGYYGAETTEDDAIGAWNRRYEW